MTKRSQRNASIERLWESNSACAGSTDRTRKIDLVNQESTDKALFRPDGARGSQKVTNPDRNWGQDKLNTSKASKVGEIRKLDKICTYKEFLTQKINTLFKC